MADGLPTGQAEPRVVRVFVSSTFRDMHAERDELIKRVFPQLRKLCEERGVTWSEVDLRWGITEEQAQRGDVLPICLAEIQRCRPYFIGLLGERYGWVPDEIPRELIEQAPWLAEHLHHSVTELEILHGVLNDPKMAHHALFYFRDRAFIESLSPDEQLDYLERPTPEDIARYGRAEAERRSKERNQKLTALKDRIRASGLPLLENYPNPQALGEKVRRDLTEIIERFYPKGSEPDSLDREALDHEAFAQKRAKVYIGRQEYFDHLNEHAESAALPLVVLGESGSGKSALLSNWALSYRHEHPDELLLMHFIGATPYSADWAAMLRRIMREFKRRFDIQQEIPDQPDALRAAFANWLHMAAVKGRVVLILDALNELEDRDGAPDLVWLPPENPPNIRLIVSTLPGRSLDDLTRRGWPVLQVERFEPHERKKLIVDYLAQYTKALSGARIERIASADQTSKPLYLRALLDELRLYGDHYTLDQRIEHYLTAATVGELYEKILQRYEEDYERDRPGLVRESMSLLWAARKGLSETELLELLGENNEPLPRARWSPLYLAAESSLVSRSGLIGFGHDYFRQAIGHKYLPTDAQQEQSHLQLAGYFEGHGPGARMIDELPWQLSEAKSWRRLSELLADEEFCTEAWISNEFDVRAYWSRIEANSSLRVVETYLSRIEGRKQYTSYIRAVAMLFKKMGHPGDALRIQQYLIENYRQAGDFEELHSILGDQANIFHGQGDLQSAMALHKEQEDICRELGDKQGLANSLGDQGNLLASTGELDGAITLLKTQERICREVGDRQGLARSFGNQANILHTQGDLDAALALHKEAERINRETGDKEGLCISIYSQGGIIAARGDIDGAMALLKVQEHICRGLGDKNILQACLGSQAALIRKKDLLCSQQDLDKSMALHKEQERICRELRNKEGIANSLGGQASVLIDQGDPGGAMGLHKEVERLRRELGDKEGVADLSKPRR